MIRGLRLLSSTADRQGSGSTHVRDKGLRPPRNRQRALQVIAAACTAIGVGFGLSAGAPATAAAQQIEFREGPFDLATSTYLGKLDLKRPYPLGDLQPTVIYNGDDRSRPLFEMWWFGRQDPAAPDLPPMNLVATDRIFYSSSADGQTWATPQVVLKGRGGTRNAADGPADVGDDHLVGSPSVLRINATYYMFYEAYATWATPINRVFSPARGDTWGGGSGMTGAWSAGFCGAGNAPDFDPSYTVNEAHLGYAPLEAKPDTVPIYTGEVRYRTHGNKLNRFASRTPTAPQCGAEDRRPLNGGEPVFWLYRQSASGRQALYSCFDPQFSNSFVSRDAQCEGHGVQVELLGYAAATRDSPDLVGTQQNRIYLATSTDGVHWTRYSGPGREGALVVPRNETTARCATPKDPYVVHYNYGAGYPAALVRDGRLELYVYDESVPGDDCASQPNNWRISLPVADIHSKGAWQAAAGARQQVLRGFGSDIAWSPVQKRYFGFGLNPLTPSLDPCDRRFEQSPTLAWSDHDPLPDQPLDLSQSFATPLPTNVGPTTLGRWGAWGGFARTALGHTVDDARQGYSAIHLYYSAQDGGACTDSRNMADLVGAYDLDHILMFVYAPGAVPPPPPPPPPAPKEYRVALQTSGGRYVSAVAGGGSTVNAKAKAIATAETYSLIDLNGGQLMAGDKVQFRTYSKRHYLVAEAGGGRRLLANRTTAGASETLTLEKVGGAGPVGFGATVALRSDKGYYVVAENGGGGAVNANRTAVGAWEQFRLQQSSR